MPKLHITNEIREFNLNEQSRDGHVVLTLIPGHSPLTMFTLAAAFQMKGYNPIILYNNGILPIKPSAPYHVNSRSATEVQRYRINAFSNDFGIKPISIDEVLGDEYSCEIAENVDSFSSFEYDNMNITPYAISSTRKYLQRYSINEDEERTIESYRGFLTGAAILADATQQIVDEFDITAALVQEPAYIHGGVPANIYSRNNIKTYTLGSGYHYKKASFGQASNRHMNPSFANKELVSERVSTELSAFKKKRIREVMHQREVGDILNIQYTPNNSVSLDVSEDHIVGVFSHLLWDAALSPQQAIYTNIFDWLSDTIEVGKEVDRTHFVIKPHPMEDIKQTDQRVEDWVGKNYDSLPANFTLLQPDTDINTYSLIRDLDAGIVYASTVGLEMVFNQVPVVTGGYPPYHGFQVTHDPRTQSSYRKIVSDIKDLECNKNMKKRARRFAYLQFVSREFDYRYFSGTPGKHIYVSRQSLLSNDDINIMINKILNNREVIRSRCGE